ncbi:2-C-methyl-D-erythritol 4-phosphate cytidylyltransferase [Serinicoccus marinus]|uniref:2-C-methyl-D-erythritol 4-phosphate cytidylyltransferase n=1 Tax=Serinicoccus marinus TaxID=247333 RepID=UPI0024939EAE|nr:2-C-methyl-D-erythritol 4-phosphate cytidylyltransferase [Serinicoccus marinus]
MVAAGQGARLGAGRPKALVPVGSRPDSRPLVCRALEGALRTSVLRHLVVVAPPDGDGVAQVRSVLQDVPTGDVTVDVVAGGEDRVASVRAGLGALPGDVGIVLVHDAARAFTPPEVFDRVVHAVRAGHAAVVPALPVTDTVKAVRAHGDVELVTGTPDRAGLRAVQTPQGFLRETLDRAHAHAAGEGRHTDDAGMVEAAGGHVVVVPGHARAMKVTTPEDLAVAAAWVDDEGEASREPCLVVLSGLPGVGKTTLARELCRRTGAAHLRVDTVEQSLVRGGLPEEELGAQGYAATLALAADQLRVGLGVVADLVNAAPQARAAWETLAKEAGSRLVRVELVCADQGVHRSRVEGRAGEIEGHRLPTWEQVQEREWEPWPGAELRIDAGVTPVADAVAAIEEACR